MNVSQVNPESSSYINKKGNELDKDAFLKILVAQLKNQDPLSPLEDKDFIAQVAQFSMLEEIRNLSTGFDKMNALNYVGKFVIAPYGDLSVQGKVDAVSLSGKNVYLHIGEYSIKAEDVTGVIYEN